MPPILLGAERPLGGLPAQRPAPEVARDWAKSVVTAVRKAKQRRVKVPLEAPVAGRVEVRLLDARGRTVSRAAVRFGKVARRTLTLPRPKRRATTVRVAWTPRGGRTDVVRRRLR